MNPAFVHAEPDGVVRRGSRIAVLFLINLKDGVRAMHLEFFGREGGLVVALEGARRAPQPDGRRRRRWVFVWGKAKGEAQRGGSGEFEKVSSRECLQGARPFGLPAFRILAMKL